MTRYLVTSALPYANGPIHFGQVIGAYLPADVYVRTLRLQGHDVAFVCGTDEYGVAITINAEKEGVDYPSYVARWRDEAKRTFDQLGIEFDVWSGTSVSPDHAELSQEFFRRLLSRGYLSSREEKQHYCPKDKKFLPDRYVEGTCPNCAYEDARGDECPRCGSWLDALELQHPRCKLCGTTPEKRSTVHFYLDLRKLRDEHIGSWFERGNWKPNVRTFVHNQLEDIGERPITRDLDWGVPVPADVQGYAPGKVLYVWFDAPIGYISFTHELARQRNDPDLAKRFWQGEDTRLVHFIGKDNIPFHCLIFPSMLHGVGQDYVLPWQVPAMEFYNLQGAKFSTSANWTIPIEAHFERYDREVTRFYLLASAPETADSEWRWEEFQRCANSGLADTIGNLATRVLRFVAKHFEGRVPALDPAHAAELDRSILTECGEIVDPADSILEYRFRRATEALLANARVANVFVDQHAPWALRKTDLARCGSVLNTACQWIAWIARWMTPFMPDKAQALWSMVGGEGRVAELGWPGTPSGEGWREIPAGRELGEIVGLFPKLDDDTIQGEIRALEERSQTASEA